MKLSEETILHYLDGHLSTEEEKDFLAAIENDNELAKLYLHHKEIHHAMEQEKLPSPSPGFADRVMQSIYQLQHTRTKFFNRSRLFVLGLIGIILITIIYYLSIKFYPTLGAPLASDVTMREITLDLNPAKNFLNSDSLFKIVFYVNGIISLFLLDRAVLKPYFARRRERYSI